LFSLWVDASECAMTRSGARSEKAWGCTAAFARRGLIEWRAGLPIAAGAAFASVCGASPISLLPRSLLETLAALLLIAMARQLIHR
jgi:uncharacterized membrane protein YfcA